MNIFQIHINREWWKSHDYSKHLPIILPYKVLAKIAALEKYIHDRYKSMNHRWYTNLLKHEHLNNNEAFQIYIYHSPSSKKQKTERETKVKNIEM